MTEAEWLKTTGIAGMLRAPGVATSARKVRLFGVACCRQVAGWAVAPRVPILADALQEAGCEDEQVLAHCRGDGPHARGC